MPAEISSSPYRRSSPGDASTDAALIEDWRGLRVVVMGLGRFGGGIGAARWLVDQGARVVVTDQAGAERLSDSTRQLSDLDIEIQLGGHDSRVLDGAGALVVSPAVDKTRSAFFADAVARDIPWTTEINLFLRRCPARVVGVTGSAGKSTTCGMIGACLQGWNGVQRHFIGGNWGGSLLGELRDMRADDVVVLELSSFQLEDLPRIKRRPDVTVLTNVWPQHLDRHGTFKAYFDAKLNMLRGVDSGTPVVLGFDDAELVARVTAVAAEWAAEVFGERDLPDVAKLIVPGRHNLINARCAAAACGRVGLDEASIRDGLASFPGLPHRMQVVDVIDGVTYINDSKATSPRAAAVGLRSVDGSVIGLIGGREKQVDVGELLSAAMERCRHVLCFGTGGQQVFEAGAGSERRGSSWRHFPTMREAVKEVRRIATSGDTVVLSPGFDSYDEFMNFEHRGETFISILRSGGGNSAGQ